MREHALGRADEHACTCRVAEECDARISARVWREAREARDCGSCARLARKDKHCAAGAPDGLLDDGRLARRRGCA